MDGIVVSLARRLHEVDLSVSDLIESGESRLSSITTASHRPVNKSALLKYAQLISLTAERPLGQHDLYLVHAPAPQFNDNMVLSELHKQDIPEAERVKTVAREAAVDGNGPNMSMVWGPGGHGPGHGPGHGQAPMDTAGDEDFDDDEDFEEDEEEEEG